MLMILRLLWPTILIAVFSMSFPLKFDAVGITFLLSALQSAVFLGIFSDRQSSPIIMYWIFSFSFFSLIPWLHYSEGVSIWRGSPLEYSTYIEVNLTIIGANFLTIIFYFIALKKHDLTNTASDHSRQSRLAPLALMAFSVIGFLGVLTINDYSLKFLLFRGIADQSRETAFTLSATTLVYTLVSRMLPVFSFYYAITEIKGRRIFKMALFFFLVMSVFPTGVSRYFVAYTYIPLIIIMFPAFRRGSVLAAVILLSLIFVFPFLDQFRYYSQDSDIRFLPSKEFFFAAHFDAYENFGSAIESNFISNGYQILGAILFFIPRVTWPEKPVGSGYEMANNLNYSFNNISMPFLGEGYVNFGFIGVIIFAISIGIIIARTDVLLSPYGNRNGAIKYRNSIYYFLFGGLFFVFRGDLLSSFAYLTASLFVAWFVGTTMQFVNLRGRW